MCGYVYSYGLSLVGHSLVTRVLLLQQLLSNKTTFNQIFVVTLPLCDSISRVELAHFLTRKHVVWLKNK
jgi:hypothetical protein